MLPTLAPGKHIVMILRNHLDKALKAFKFGRYALPQIHQNVMVGTSRK